MIRDRDRIEGLRRALKQARLDALLLRLPENIVMSFGVWPMNGFSYGLFTADAGPATLIAPSCEDEEMIGGWADDLRFFTWPRLNMEDPWEAIRRECNNAAQRQHLTRARVGYEGSFEWVAPAHNAGEVMVACESSTRFLKSLLPLAKWSDATELLNQQRATKTSSEIAKLRVAHRVACLGLNAFHTSVRPGITEAKLAALVYTRCLTGGVRLPGVRHVNVFPQISSGPNTHRAWRPIVTTGRRHLQDGDVALLELAVCVDGFWADVTRVKVAGEPSPVQRHAFAAVRAAQSAAMKCIKPGIPACYPHEVATEILIEAGFRKQLVHLTGHGVGFRYHEPEPFLMPGNPLKLRPGHVCSVEPGLYDHQWGGIRLEDNVAVSSTAAENLTTAPKKL